MNQSKILVLIPKVIIWLCLAVILFSPLYVSSHLFFPFIVTKTLVFNIAVEVMVLAFLFLASISGDYKIRINLAVILVAVYIILSFISSLAGDNFYRSFWSNNERSEGLLLLLHLFLFLVVLSSFFRKIKSWLLVFDTFFFASFLVALIALGQYFKLDWLFASGDGQRLAGTIGNAGYMAGYLVFAVFLGLLLVFKRKTIYLKIYYLIVMALEVFIIFGTGTRGGMLALLLGAFLFVLYLLFFYFKNKYLKLAGVVVILLALGLPLVVFANKDSHWVKSNFALNRLSTISATTVTAQYRFMTWQAAWQGFKKKSVLGWGQENFYQPFDKYFNPKIFRHGGSVVWYDRAHNIVFDRLVTGGILGLLSYLALLFVPCYFLWRQRAKKEPEAGNDQEKKGKRYFIQVIFSLIVLAYFIQNLFIFEALATYIPLFLVLSFIGLFGWSYDWQPLASRRVKLAFFIFWLIVFLPILYFVNLKPLNANLTLTKALSSQDLSVSERIDLFKQVLSQQTPGNQEYRRQLFNLLEALITQKFPDKKVISDLADFTGSELNKQIAENPHSVSNYLLLMRFNSSMFSQTGNLDYLNKNLDLFDQAKELSPARQVIYFEIGYSYIAMGNYFKQTSQGEMAQKYYDLAVDNFRYALELNDTNFESYRQLISALIYAGKNQDVLDFIDQMNQKEKEKIMDDYDHTSFFTSVINIGVSVKNYQIARSMAQKLIEIDPKNPLYYVQLALAEAYLGNNNEAITVAQKVAEFGDDYKKQSEDFIQKVKAGDFSK
ncbi:MAG: O-antigen ligase family protein [Patescibacteria group bacterium]